MIYAINRKTKEHIGTNLSEWNAGKWPSMRWKIVDADAGGWIPWKGRVCPLPDGVEAELKYRDGCERSGVTHLGWNHSVGGRDDDIIAYRPILDSEPEAPEWDGEGFPPAGIIRRCVVDSERYLQDWIDGDLIELEGEDRYHGPINRVMDDYGIDEIACALEAMRAGRWPQVTALMAKLLTDIESEIRKDA